MRSRVIPGSFVTIDRRVPVSLLKSVDLPTLGRPKITNDGSICVMLLKRQADSREPQQRCNLHSTASHSISLNSPYRPNVITHSERADPVWQPGQKKRAPGWLGSSFRRWLSRILEDDLRDKLHVERFTRSKPRRTVEVTDGVTDHAAAADAPRASGQVDSVGYVEHVRAQLDLQPLANRDVLDDGKIHISEPRTVVPVPREVAVRVGGSRATRSSGYAERRRVHPLFSAIRCGERMVNASERICNYVQTRTLRSGKIGSRRVKWLSSVKVNHAAELPAVSEQLRPPRTAGHVIGNEGGKVVPCVEVAVPVFLLQIEAVQ